MSYILDALRRAQAERGRGSVPGLHTPAASVPQPVQQAPRSGGHRGAWPIAAVAVVAAGALAWLQFSPRTSSREPVVVAKAPEPATSTSTSAASIPAPAPAAEPASVAAPAPSTMPAPEPKPAPVFVDVTPPPPPPAPPVPATRRVEPAKPARQDAAKPPLPTPQEPAAAPVTAAAPAPAAPAAAAVAGPVYTMANLPPRCVSNCPTCNWPASPTRAIPNIAW